MSTNIDKLRELAMGATGGAWRTESYYDMDGVRRTILIPFSLELPPGMEESDMAYIAAANPDAVLALLDEVEAAHAARREAQARVAELTEQVQKLGRELHRHKLDTARLDWLADVHGTGCSAGSEGSSTVGHGQAIEPDSGAGGLGNADRQPARWNAGGPHAAQAEHGAQGSNDHRLGDAGCGLSGRLADTTNERQHGWGTSQTSDGRDAARIEPERLCDAGRLEHASSRRRERREAPAPGHIYDGQASVWAQGEHGSGVTGAHWLHQHRAGPVNGFWADADWLFCRDGKWRPVESSASPLVDGAPARVGRLRGYGNAINAQQATAFIEAVMGLNV